MAGATIHQDDGVHQRRALSFSALEPSFANLQIDIPRLATKAWPSKHSTHHADARADCPQTRTKPIPKLNSARPAGWSYQGPQSQAARRRCTRSLTNSVNGNGTFLATAFQIRFPEPRAKGNGHSTVRSFTVRYFTAVKGNICPGITGEDPLSEQVISAKAFREV